VFLITEEGLKMGPKSYKLICLLTLFLAFMLINFIFNEQPVRAAQVNLNITEKSLLPYLGNFIDLDEFADQFIEVRSFSAEGQEQLMDLAARYDIDYKSSGEINLKKIEGLNLRQESSSGSFKFDLLPGLFIQADYDSEEDYIQLGLASGLELEYYMNDDTLITANLTGRDLIDLINKGDIYIPDGGLDDDNEKLSVDYQGGLGISYRSSANLILTADFLQRNFLFGGNNFLTGIGLEYIDDEYGQLQARYFIDSDGGEMEAITDLELALRDLATFSATYKIINPDILYRDQLARGSQWDLGLNINLTDLSRLSFGYRQMSEEPLENGFERDISINRSNIEASFQIDF